jgi:hypothetical protein
LRMAASLGSVSCLSASSFQYSTPSFRSSASEQGLLGLCLQCVERGSARGARAPLRRPLAAGLGARRRPSAAGGGAGARPERRRAIPPRQAIAIAAAVAAAVAAAASSAAAPPRPRAALTCGAAAGRRQSCPCTRLQPWPQRRAGAVGCAGRAGGWADGALCHLCLHAAATGPWCLGKARRCCFICACVFARARCLLAAASGIMLCAWHVRRRPNTWRRCRFAPRAHLCQRELLGSKVRRHWWAAAAAHNLPGEVASAIGGSGGAGRWRPFRTKQRLKGRGTPASEPQGLCKSRHTPGQPAPAWRQALDNPWTVPRRRPPSPGPAVGHLQHQQD